MAWREGRSPGNICRIVFLMKVVVGKTEADSPNIEIFNCAISAYEDANQACKRAADVAMWHSTWLLAHSPRYLRALLKWYQEYQEKLNKSLLRTFPSKKNPTASSWPTIKENPTGNLVAFYLIQETWIAVSNLKTQIFKPLSADQFVPYSSSYCSNSHWHQRGKH